MRVREIGRAGARAPLLVVLDGPDYARRASLPRLLGRLVDAGEAPPHRVALVVADDRMETYSASTPFARALVAALDDLVLNARDGARPVPTTITCGLDEENYANNAALAQALAAQGYPVDFHAARGAHDWPTWRRALDAHLAALLRRTLG